MRLRINNKFLLYLANKYLFRNKFNINSNRCNNKNSIIGLNLSLIRNTSFDIFGKNNVIRINSNCNIYNSRIKIYGDNSKIIIGEKCTLNNVEFHLEDANSSISVGSNTLFTGKIHIASTEGEEIIIGSNCLFSSDIDIRNGDSHSIIDNVTKKRINNAKNIIIGDNVWCGRNVSILKGTVIPRNSVIGSVTVVTKSFEEENTIIVGNPARVVKRNISWKNERI